MCDRCIELDEKIDLYRQLSTWVIESETRRGIETLVQKYQVDKTALHPPRPALGGRGSVPGRLGLRSSIPDAQ